MASTVRTQLRATAEEFYPRAQKQKLVFKPNIAASEFVPGASSCWANLQSLPSVTSYWFYHGCTPEAAQVDRLVKIAESVSTHVGIQAKAVLIRSGLHCITYKDGIYQYDPAGWHVTLSIKGEVQVKRQSHITYHAYTSSSESCEVTMVTKSNEKLDSVPKHSGNGVSKPVWPSVSDLDPVIYRQTSKS